MIEPKSSFFSSFVHCFKRTKEQREFEQKLYLKGLKYEEDLMLQKINEALISKELAVKFILQELDVAHQGDTFLQYFAKKSGFHISEYSGALEKFQHEQKELEKIQSFFLDFLNKISDEKVMFQTAISILNRVMEHWEIGKYSAENEASLKEEKIEEEIFLDKKNTISELLLQLKKIKIILLRILDYLDTKMQILLDTFKENSTTRTVPKSENTFREESEEISTKNSNFKQNIKVKKEVLSLKETFYTKEKVEELMEEYSPIIEEVITGNMNPKNHLEVQKFQEQMSLAALEGNNLAMVFCTFFELEDSSSNLPFSLTQLDNVSKAFLIDILNNFEKKGFSDALHQYLKENRENAYALAINNDKYMQYLVAFWYIGETNDDPESKEKQYLWYNKSALNGFQPAKLKVKSE